MWGRQRTFALLVLVATLFPRLNCNAQEGNSLPEASPQAVAKFSELVERYKGLLEAYRKLPEPEDYDAYLEHVRKHHPINLTVADFLALEEKSRGTRIGFSCLYHLVRVAESNELDAPDVVGRRTSLQRLGQHYASYPDVDMVAEAIHWGTSVPETEPFLRRLIDASSIDHVKANAIHALARLLASEANAPDLCKASLMAIDKEGPYYRETLKYLTDLAERTKDINIDEMRAEVRKLIEQMRSDFPDELVPPAFGRTPAVIEVGRGRVDMFRKRARSSIVDRIPSILFELDHPIGQPGPPIEGVNSDGEPMKLSDFGGKVVVLMFSFKGCGPCEEMYPDNRRMLEKYNDRPFAILGIQRDETMAVVRETVESGTITWPVWWDGEDRAISRQWNVHAWPGIFVLDTKGNIRFRDLRFKELENAVEILLKESGS